MTPYIVMGVIVVGMGFNAWFVLGYLDRKERDHNKHRH